MYNPYPIKNRNSTLRTLLYKTVLGPVLTYLSNMEGCQQQPAQKITNHPKRSPEHCYECYNAELANLHAAEDRSHDMPKTWVFK